MKKKAACGIVEKNNAGGAELKKRTKKTEGKTLTIRKRIAISNLIMLAVPVLVTVIMGILCGSLIAAAVENGAGFAFEDGDDFYEASQTIFRYIEDKLEEDPGADLSAEMGNLTRWMDEQAIAITLQKDTESLYSYGQAMEEDDALQTAIATLGGTGFVSNGNRGLFAGETAIQGEIYRIYIYSSPRQVTQISLTAALWISGISMALAVCGAVFFTNRFLVKFLYKRIEKPLQMLQEGASQIGEGHLEYRIDYIQKDEFGELCLAFNRMAGQLKAYMEQVEKHEQSRKELLAGISHDLRSPLTAIRAYGEGLLDQVVTTPQARQTYLNMILQKAEEMNRLLSKIFLFSKMDLGEYPDHPELLQLEEETDQLVKALEEEYREKGLTIRCGTLSPARILADPDQLRSVMVNIFENSLKYKGPPRGHLEIWLETGKESCRLYLKDDGPGVPEEALPHLFDVFYRADPSRQKTDGGSGLGLAIAAKAIARMGGSIQAENGKDGGLCILIILPLYQEKGGTDVQNTDY